MRKERRRLVLSGTDDAYAKREAVREMNPVEAPTPDPVAPEKSAPKRDGPKFGPNVQTEKHLAMPTADAEPPQKAGLSIQVNYRLNLGHELSDRLQRLADANDQPIVLVMKGIRSKAAERFRTLVSEATKPPPP